MKIQNLTKIDEVLLPVFCYRLFGTWKMNQKDVSQSMNWYNVYVGFKEGNQNFYINFLDGIHKDYPVYATNRIIDQLLKVKKRYRIQVHEYMLNCVNSQSNEELVFRTLTRFAQDSVYLRKTPVRKLVPEANIDVLDN